MALDIVTEAECARAACMPPEEIQAELVRLNRTYPGETALEVLGRSPGGRPISVLRLGREDAKRHILLQGAIHAREHMNAWLLLRLAEQELEKGVREDFCWHFLPMMNPDGAVVSQTGRLNALQEAIYRRDLAAGRTSENMAQYARRWKANGLGTDLNRQFPAGWELVTRGTEPSSENYRGEAPFSAPEAAVLRDYTVRYPFAVTLSYHSTGSVIYYEYGKRQPVNDLSRSLGEAVSAVTGYPMEGCGGLDGAGCKDWAMDSLGIPSLTIETGVEDAPLAPREAVDIWDRNREVLSAAARWMEKEDIRYEI